MRERECPGRSPGLPGRETVTPGRGPLYLVSPEGGLDEPGRFVELPLLVVGQRELRKLVLHLLAGRRAQELRPVGCGGQARLLESDFAGRRASRAQAGIRRRGERLDVRTPETRGHGGDW